MLFLLSLAEAGCPVPLEPMVAPPRATETLLSFQVPAGAKNRRIGKHGQVVELAAEHGSIRIEVEQTLAAPGSPVLLDPRRLDAVERGARNAPAREGVKLTITRETLETGRGTADVLRMDATAAASTMSHLTLLVPGPTDGHHVFEIQVSSTVPGCASAVVPLAHAVARTLQ